MQGQSIEMDNLSTALLFLRTFYGKDETGSYNLNETGLNNFINVAGTRDTWIENKIAFASLIDSLNRVGIDVSMTDDPLQLALMFATTPLLHNVSGEVDLQYFNNIFFDKETAELIATYTRSLQSFWTMQQSSRSSAARVREWITLILMRRVLGAFSL